MSTLLALIGSLLAPLQTAITEGLCGLVKALLASFLGWALIGCASIATWPILKSDASHQQTQTVGQTQTNDQNTGKRTIDVER